MENMIKFNQTRTWSIHKLVPLDIIRHMERFVRPSKVLPSCINFLGTQCTSMYNICACLVR